MFLAASCAQGATQIEGLKALLRLQPAGLQLTPGWFPVPGFRELLDRVRITVCGASVPGDSSLRPPGLRCPATPPGSRPRRRSEALATRAVVRARCADDVGRSPLACD